MNNQPQTSQFQLAIEVVEALSPDDQMQLIYVIKRRLIEKRRDEIAQAGADTLKAVREGRAKIGYVEDLRRDVEIDE
jgi:hypothetical protein